MCIRDTFLLAGINALIILASGCQRIGAVTPAIAFVTTIGASAWVNALVIDTTLIRLTSFVGVGIAHAVAR